MRRRLSFRVRQMSALIPINNINVNFEVVNDEVFATSFQIAEVFEKNHANILRIINKLPDDEFKSANFIKHSYIDKTGRVLPCYNLTRDGFSLLVMGFTGEKAYQWKIEFIKAFNMMEAELKRQGVIRYTDKIAELDACAKLEAKNHKNAVNGYRSQISRRNNQIATLKRELAKFEDKKQRMGDISYENLKALYHNTRLDYEYFKKQYKEKELKERAIGEALSRINGHVKSLIDYIYD